MTTQPSGVFVTHNPIGTPGHQVSLALRDHGHTARAPVILDCAPPRNLSYMPPTVKSGLVGVIGIKRGGGQIARGRRLTLSATFRVLTPAGPVLPSHESIVT